MAVNQKMHKGARACRGFTLAETLVAVLIMLMVSSVVAAGIPSAQRAYDKVVVSANAEVLLSTSVSALRDELGTARDIYVENDTDLFYYSADTGNQAKIYPDSDGILMLEEYIGFQLPDSSSDTGNPPAGTTPSSGQKRQLVTNAAATRDLYITYESVSASGGMVTINGLKVCRKSTGSVVTTVDRLLIRSVYADGT